MSIPGAASPLFLATTAGAAAGFEISRSLRFNPGDSATLTRTQTSVGNRKIFTISLWAKKSQIGTTYEDLLSCRTGGQFRFIWEPNGNLEVYSNNGSITTFHIDTVALFRDPSAWYHFVVSVDATNTSVKFYVNGVELTDFVVHTAVQNADTIVNTATAHTIGKDPSGSYFSGYLAEFNFIDGQALDSSSFGAFDTNGVWQAIDTAGLTFGTNGFRLKFADNSSNAALGTDSSGNSNSWTVNNLIAAGESISTDAIVNVASNTVTGSWNQTGTNFPTDSSSTICGSNSGSTETITKTYAAPLASTGAFRAKTSCGSAKTIQVAFNGQTAVNYACTSGFSVWNSSISCPTSITSISLIYPGLGTPGFDLQNLSLDGTTNELIANDIALTTASNNNYSSLAVGDSNNAGVSITAINSSTPSISVDGGSWSNGDVFSTATNVNADNLRDSPTNGTASTGGDAGGATVGNYATFNPLAAGVSSSGSVADIATLSDGNLQATSVSNKWAHALATIALPSSGKWYCEFECKGSNTNLGIFKYVSQLDNPIYGASTTRALWYGDGGQVYYNIDGSYQLMATPATYGAGDIVGVAVDSDNDQVKFYKNNSLAYTATIPSTIVADLNDGKLFFGSTTYNGTAVVVNFGARSFAYSAPTNFKSLNTANLPTPTIADGSKYFDTVLWTGNGSSKSIGGLSFSPEFVWGKRRNSTNAHWLMDVVRGAGKRLISNETSAEDTKTDILSAFNSDGFTIGNNTESNASGGTYIGWTWDGGTSTVTNNDGSIASQVRASAASGFSIVTYTGTGANATFGHGLNVPVEMVIIKQRNGTGFWVVGHKDLPFTNDYYMSLNTSDAVSTGAGGVAWQSTAPTSSVVSIGSSSVLNGSGNTHVAYCFAPVNSYSAMGSYQGNGNANGPFVFTGFKPSFILIKNISAGSDWRIFDTDRSPINAADKLLFPNANDAEKTNSGYNTDILSNGFKIRGTHSGVNTSGNTYIYLALASNPFASNGGLAR